MSDIELRNENGKIVGYDSAGNKIPVSFEDGLFDSVDTDKQNNSVFWATEDQYPRWSDVQSLIDNVPEGSTVKLEARDYPFDFLDNNENAVVISKNDITLEGSGWASRICLEDNTTNTDEGADILEVTAPNVTIQNLQIDGNQGNNSPGETGTTEDGHNIQFTRSADNGRVRNVLSQNGTGDGVEATLCEQVLIENSTFLNNWEHNVQFNGAKRSEVSGCILADEVNNGQVDLWTGSGNTTREIIISHNLVIGGQQEGIKVGPTSGTVRDVSVIGNYIIDNSLQGVRIEQADNVLVSNNQITGSGRAGVRVWDGCTKVTISDNHIESSTRDGVTMGSAATGVPKNVSVKENRIYRNAQDGIASEGGQNIIIQSNEIHDNGFHGIQLHSGPFTDLVVGSNQVYDNSQGDSASYDAVNINTSDTITRVYVESNRITSTTSALHRHGIKLNASGDITESYLRDNDVTKQHNQAYYVPNSITALENNTPIMKVNLANYSSPDGVVMYHNGLDANSNPVGRYERVGGTWHGLSAAQGSTI